MPAGSLGFSGLYTEKWEQIRASHNEFLDFKESAGIGR